MKTLINIQSGQNILYFDVTPIEEVSKEAPFVANFSMAEDTNSSKPVYLMPLQILLRTQSPEVFFYTIEEAEKFTIEKILTQEPEFVTPYSTVISGIRRGQNRVAKKSWRGAGNLIIKNPGLHLPLTAFENAEIISNQNVPLDKVIVLYTSDGEADKKYDGVAFAVIKNGVVGLWINDVMKCSCVIEINENNPTTSS